MEEQVWKAVAMGSAIAGNFQQGQSLEGAARSLFVHPNTVRYRIRQVADITGLSATDAREALTLQLALVLGRQAKLPEEL